MRAPDQLRQARILVAAGLPLVYPGPMADGIGLALVIAVMAMQKLHNS